MKQREQSPSPTARYAEPKAEAHRDRFWALAAATGQIVWESGPDGGPTDDMPLWRAYTGQTPAEVADGGWLNAVHPDDRQGMMGQVRQALQAGAPYQVQYRLRGGDGRYRTFLARSTPTRAAAGQPVTWVGYCVDLTQHIENQERLSVQYQVSALLTIEEAFEQHVDRLLEIIGQGLHWDVVALWQRKSNQQDSLHCAASWSRSPNEWGDVLAALNDAQLPSTHGLAGKVWKQETALWTDVLGNEARMPLDTVALTGGLRTAFAFPVLGTEGVLGVIVCATTEARRHDAAMAEMAMTIGRLIGQHIDRQRMDEALMAEERLRHSLLANCPDSIISMDEAGKVLEFNATAERTFGYRADQALGRSMADLIIPPSYRALHHAGVRTYLRTGEGPLLNRRVDISAMRADGSEFPVQLAITAARVDGHALFTGYLNDRTEEHELLRERDALLLAEQEAHERAESVARQLQAVQDLSDAMLANLPLHDLLQALLGRLQRIFKADVAAILLLDEEQRVLTPRMALGLPPEAVARIRIPLGHGVDGRVAETGEAAALDQDQTARLLGGLGEHPTSLLVVPLRAAGRVIGVIHLDRASDGKFTESDIQIIELAALRIALAIDRSQLYEAERVAHQDAARRGNELQTVFASIADGVFVFDGDQHVVMANNRALSLLGRAPAEPLASPDGNEEREEPDDPTPHTAVAHAVSQLSTVGGRFHIRDEEGRLLSQAEWPITRILKGETIDNAIEMTISRADRLDIDLSLTGSPMRDEQEHITGAVVVLRDVTERRRLERSTHDALRALLRMAETLVAVDNEESGDDVIKRLAGHAREVMAVERVAIAALSEDGTTLRPLGVDGMTLAEEEAWWEEQRRQPPALITDHSRLPFAERLRAGEVLLYDPPEPRSSGAVSVLVAPMRINDQLVGVVAMDHGRQQHHYSEQEIARAGVVGKLVTLVLERERLLNEREEARASELALRDANQRMDEFLSIASHELKTPLTGIKGNIQFMQRQLKRVAAAGSDGQLLDLPTQLAKVWQTLERTDRQCSRLTRLVDDLLDVSRIQADRFELTPTSCDLTEVVREAVNEQTSMTRGRQIELTVAGASGEGGNDHGSPLLVMAEADRIGQVVTNFLTNALKYAGNDRPIVVELGGDDGRARVSVTDKGPGLSEDQQQHIWERFYRAPGARAHGFAAGPGLGLGLHISKTIIEQHGGQVGVISTPGAGSTFWFTLPLQAKEEAGDGAT